MWRLDLTSKSPGLAGIVCFVCGLFSHLGQLCMASLRSYSDPVRHNVCLVLGDSYIARLRAIVMSAISGNTDMAHDYKLSLGIEHNFHTILHGVEGRTIAKVQAHDLVQIPVYKPSLVLVHVGGNDITSEDESPGYVAMELVNLTV